MEVRFVDTTFRDGSQSLWASGLRTGMIEAVAAEMDRAGFEVIEVPVQGVYFKKFVRDLKEDPWEMARKAARLMPNTTKSCMFSAGIQPFEAPPPRSLVELFFKRLVATGALNRSQSVCNTYDQIKRDFPWQVPLFRELGLKVALALSYTVSPRHTDEYYGAKTRALLPFKPDVIYLKDQGGLLTVDRIRTLMPVILANAGGIPVELHSHCTTGAAPLVYLEALKLGVATLHTALPPLANGSAQPSVFNITANARLLGHSVRLDEALVRSASDRLMSIARQDKLPIGAPLEYDHAQYVHQVPGGVISNLRHQLAGLRILHRLDEVLEETVQVRKDLGYPIMITPFSQFVVTQSAINVATGERYKHVIDDLIVFAQGGYGEDSGYTWMDQNLKDRFLALPRSKELAALQQRRHQVLPLKAIRDKLGGAGVSDEEFLLRYIMNGREEIDAMRAAGPARQYSSSSLPLLELVRKLTSQKQVRYVQVQSGTVSLVVERRLSSSAC